MESFSTVTNMKTCEAVFSKYMQDKFGLSISQNVSNVRRILWRVMQDVKANPPAGVASMGVRELNDMALNIARDVYLSMVVGSQPGSQATAAQQQQANPKTLNLQMQQQQQQGTSPLERENALYGGSRPLAVNTLLPAVNMKEPSEHATNSYERMLSERRSADGLLDAQQQPSWKPEKVDKANEKELDDMVQRLARLRNSEDLSGSPGERDVNTQLNPQLASRKPSSLSGQDTMGTPTFIDTIDTLNTGVGNIKTDLIKYVHTNDNDRSDPLTVISRPDDSAAVLRSFQRTKDTQPESMSSAHRVGHSSSGIDTDINMEIMQRLPKDAHRRIVNKYLSINSVDRDWFKDPFRYTYTVTFAGYGENDAQNQYRNVTAMAVTRVVLPMEIRESISLNVNLANRSEYMNDYSFNYPYVMVCIEGLDDVYDGTNDRVRRAFSLMAFETAYRTKNGRGFIVLQPMQQEKKLFYPVPLGNLRTLKISLIKPNGAVLNNSTDDYLLSKVEHEDYNPAHIRIVLDKYFDKNDYFVGDSVLFRGYTSKQLSDEGPVDAGSYQRLNDFINRAEGHEIVEVGQVNDNCYYRTFYIMAPGALDKTTGRLILDHAMITTINAFNVQQQAQYATSPELYDKVVNGAVCNASLQNTIAFTVWYEIFDPKIDMRTQ
jgi:hypothetical protein